MRLRRATRPAVVGALILIALAPAMAIANGIVVNARYEETRTLSCTSREKVFDALFAVTKELPGWELVEAIGRRGTVRVRIEVRPLGVGHTDEVSAVIAYVESGTAVRLRSSSRIAVFASDRRRVHELFDRLEEKLHRWAATRRGALQEPLAPLTRRSTLS